MRYLSIVLIVLLMILLVAGCLGPGGQTVSATPGQEPKKTLNRSE